jgi:acetoin utilization deacetylase AcuC-like enzyme
MRVTHAGFAQMAARLRQLAERLAGGRIVAVLEGGYDLEGLGGGMTATLNALVAASPPVITPVALPAEGTLARAAIEGTLAAHRGLSGGGA